MEGEVVEAFPNGMFKIQLDEGLEVLGYTAGKMRRLRIKIFPGDRVKVEVSRTTSHAAGSSTATASGYVTSRRLPVSTS